MAEKFLFEFSDNGSLDRLAGRVNSFLERLRQLRAAVAESGSTEGFDPVNDAALARVEAARKRINDLVRELAQLKQNLEDIKAGRPFAGQNLTEAQKLGLSSVAPQGGGAQVQKEIGEVQKRIAQERVQLNELLLQSETDLAAEAQRAIAINNQTVTQQRTLVELARELESFKTGGQARGDLAQQRRANLEERQLELQRQLAEERRRIEVQTPRNVGLKALQEEAAISREMVALEARRTAIRRQLNAELAKTKARDVSQTQPTVGPQNENERLALVRAREEAEARIIALRQKDSDTTGEIMALEQRRLANRRAIEELEKTGQATAGSSQILGRIGEINEALARLDTSEVEELNRVAGVDLDESLERLIVRARQLASSDLAPEDEAAELAAIRLEANQLLATVRQLGSADIPPLFDEAELLGDMGFLQRTLLTTFTGLGQRFRATLQFALSGALLFQAQRLAREFFQAMVDVQKSFADIASSLEFDINTEGFERGTFEFERRLEGARREVLKIANDLNVLPVEANEAAFQMISRFSSIDAALIATRAQLLATRVSTIDQSEALRALTAVAESYGQTIDDSVTGQERQIRIAQLYAQALDGAVVIQQQYGTTVEDTIEGSAGLAELLAAQGFSLAQTQAMISQVIQRTAVTGATAADKIGRSIGQLTNPAVRDKVLELAAGLDNFFLTAEDFTDAEEALRRINEELERLEATDPSAAIRAMNDLTQIIGQRREAAFVAPLLGTADQQAEIVDSIAAGAGAAEERFSVLAKTVDQLLQSIVVRFQELAQNVERIGLLSPLQVFLEVLDKALSLLNGITLTVESLIGLFNRIRIPGIGIGLGDAAKNAFSLLLAFTALKSLGTAIVATMGKLTGGKGLDMLRQLFTAITGAKTAQAGSALLDIVGGIGIPGRRRAGAPGTADGEAARSLAILPRFAAGLRAFVQSPLAALDDVSRALFATFTRLTTQLATSNAVTLLTIAAEDGLAAARSRLNLASLGSLFTGLAGVIGTIIRFVGRLAIGLGVITIAVSAIGSLFEIIGGIPRAIQGVGQEIEADRAARRTELEETGLDPARAKIEQLEEEIADLGQKLGDRLASFTGTITDAVLQGLFNVAPHFPGTSQQLGEQIEDAQVELLEARILEIIDVTRSLRDLPQVNAEAEQNLAEANEKVDALIAQYLLFLDMPPAIGAPARIERGAILAELLEQSDIAIETVDELLGGATDAVEGTANAITEALREIQQRLSIGVISPEDASREIIKQVENAAALLKAATREGNQDDIDAAQNAFNEAQQAQVQVFEAEKNFAQEIAGFSRAGIPEARANLDVARSFLERALVEHADKPFLIKRLYLELAQAERALNEAIREEARQRLQLELDRSRTFADQLAAIQALQRAIEAEIIAREGAAEFFSGRAQGTVEEQGTLIDLENQEADVRMRQAILRARLNVLEKASSLDNLAAIQANIAGLQAELAEMRARGDEPLELQEKAIEIQNEIANLRLAEADRRAAFFRLTAGTGDEIKAAQADLRAAQDRLATITALGGAETQQGYEAELDVLRARARLADLASRFADLTRRATSDLTDSLEQAFLDVAAAQDALKQANGPLEKLQAEIDLANAEASAQQAFYDRRIDDLDFLFQTDQIGRAQYIAGLRALQAGVDRTTRQGEEIWRDLELQIRSLTDQAADLSFNIPTEIRLPTLFEVRRALAADQMGVSYMDNRQMDITIEVRDATDLGTILATITGSIGGGIVPAAGRFATGAAGLTLGAF